MLQKQQLIEALTRGRRFTNLLMNWPMDEMLARLLRTSWKILKSM